MTTAPNLKGVHHVAYRCKDAKETMEFYRKALGMDFQLAASSGASGRAAPWSSW